MGGSGNFHRPSKGVPVEILPGRPARRGVLAFAFDLYEPGPIRDLITRTATERVVKVNRSLSQISANVPAARDTASVFCASQAETRAAASSADAPSAGQPTARTSRVSAACAPYRSSRSADLDIAAQRSSRGSATTR